jgi:hypothetical protein
MALLAQVLELSSRYDTVCEAIIHQNLVIEQLQSLLATKCPPTALRLDSAQQTDAIADDDESIFLRAVDLKMRIMRTMSRRVAFESESRRVLMDMASAVQVLEERAGDTVPATQVVHGILQSCLQETDL